MGTSLQHGPDTGDRTMENSPCSCSWPKPHPVQLLPLRGPGVGAASPKAGGAAAVPLGAMGRGHPGEGRHTEGQCNWGAACGHNAMGEQRTGGAPRVMGISAHAGGSSAGVHTGASPLSPPGATSPVPCVPAGFRGRAPRPGPTRGGNGGWAGMARAAAVPRPFLQNHRHKLCQHGLSRGSAPPGAPGKGARKPRGRGHGDPRAHQHPLLWVPAGDGHPPKSSTGGWGGCTAPCRWVLTFTTILGFSSIFLAL